MHSQGFKVYQKSLLFWLTYMVFHFIYRLLPVLPVAMFLGINESVFQHIKMGFFTYFTVSFVEYGAFRSRILNKQSFIFSRLEATIFIPWVICVLWYVAPAFYGQMPNNVLEAVYGISITLIAGYFTAVLEQGLEQINYSKPLKVAVIILFLVTCCLGIALTFSLPWADVFAEPKWK
jgi:hypothetical protein